MVRRSLAGLVAVGLVVCWWPPATRADVDNPHAFIQTLGGQAIQILSNPDPQ